MWFHLAWISILILMCLLSSIKKYKNAPPGPFNWPIFGNIFQLVATGEMRQPAAAMSKLAEKYGGVMSLKLGQLNAIMITKWEDYKEIIPREELADRAADGAMADRNFGDLTVGIGFSNGQRWVDIRRWTIRTLRDFGFGKTNTQDALFEAETDELVQYILRMSESNNGVLRVENFHSLSTLNVLWAMVAGYRYDLDDRRLRQLLHLSFEQLKATTFSASMSLAFPFIRYIFPGVTGRSTLLKALYSLEDYLLESLKEHQSRPDFADNPQCVIDVFAKRMLEEKDDPMTMFTERNFVMTMMDLFQTGSETSANVLDYALLFMILYPDVQEKVRAEIERKIPGENTVGLQHKSELPYTYATSIELFRCANIVPIQVNRRVTKDFYHNGYLFRKGMMILPNVYPIFNDREFWGDPEVFRPERYIGPDGKLIPEKIERITPFGLGKRVCLGQQLAESIVFCFFATVVQKLKLRVVPGQGKPTAVPRDGVTTSARPFDILVERVNK